VIVLKGSRKNVSDMIALDHVCHVHVNILGKTLERATSFVTSAFDCFFWSSRSDWSRIAITLRRMRRLEMNVSLCAEGRESSLVIYLFREESSIETVVLALLSVQILYLLCC